jgi:hypothetical protein
MQGTVVPNPFEPVPVTVGDREALYGGLISAGHPTEYARHQADTLPDTDGALQMLARYRLAALATGAVPTSVLAGKASDLRQQRDQYYAEGRPWKHLRFAAEVLDDLAAASFPADLERMRNACIAAVRAEQKYEGSDFPVCNAIVRAIEQIPAIAAVAAISGLE